MNIEATYADRVVKVDGRRLSPRRSQRVWNHSPDGFAWGYGGSGPAQLALALLLRAGIAPDRAVRLHQQFKWQIVARQQGDWTLEIDIAEWARAHDDGAHLIRS